MRVVLEPSEHSLAFDLTWEGAIPAFEEPQHFIRKYGRVLFDSKRFAQTGCWRGTLTIGDETFTVTPDRWWGTRDRSWGVRPVGEPEHPGIRQAEGQMSGMWNYSPMQFRDYSILYILNETDDGERPLEEAVRIWNDPAQAPAAARPSRAPPRADAGDAHDRVVGAVVSRTRPAAPSTCAPRCSPRASSPSAPGTAWSRTGGTACSRVRWSCRAS